MDDATTPSIAVKGGWYRLHELSTVIATLWQPIETAPKDGNEILIFGGQLRRIAFWDEARGGVWSKWPGREQVTPTHWMPLPESPVE